MGKTNEIIKQIDFYISIALKAYNNQDDATYKIHMWHIQGMIEALTILTGKHYTVTADGLKEQ